MINHSLISKDVIPRQIALQFFQRLAKSPRTELTTAIDWIQQGTVKLSLADCTNDLKEFAETKSIAVPNAEPILEALFSIEGLRASLDWTGSNLVEFLASEAKNEKLVESDSDLAATSELLNKFFESSTKLEITRKAQRVYDGLLPNYESCFSLVEFRPIFNIERREITNGIIAATLTLQMRSTEPGGALETVSIQLDANDIDELATELTALRTKIRALYEFVAKQTVLLNPSRSLEGKSEQ